jgi:serine phosphatase RsbU (regulator of sigma subunit)
MAGRCFRDQQLLAARRPGGVRVWTPVTHRADRLGVLSLTLAQLDADTRAFCVELGLHLAHLIVASDLYTDAYHIVRRRRNMDLAAEMQWNLLPPLAFASEHVAVAGMIEPAYEVGGDVFDYAVNNSVVDYLILDAVGHNLGASLLSALAIGAYRHCRRSLIGLEETVKAMDRVIVEQFGDEAFATAIIGQLDPRSGLMRAVCAGHPPPLLVREHRVVGELTCQPRLPLGMGGDTPVYEEMIEPGDRIVFYTDGVPEARSADGEPFGEQRMIDALEREAASGSALLEILRRIIDDVARYCDGALQDDASVLALERQPRLPQTAPARNPDPPGRRSAP